MTYAETDRPILASEVSGESGAVRAACHAGGDSNSAESLTALNALAVPGCRSVAPRLFLALWPDGERGEWVIASGVLAALESPDLCDVPPGGMLLTDADATRGRVVAERARDGWVLRFDDWDGGRRA